MTDNNETQDGVQVAATMKSLAMDLHQIILGKRQTAPDNIHYYFMHHVSDLFQFAKTSATTTKLQMILETLQQAETALYQEKDVETLLRNSWRLMRSVLSREEIEKIVANQIELRRSGMEPLVISGVDAWEQANRILQEWSTPENEDQRVEYVISYDDGLKEGRWLNLPLFYKMHDGERWRIGPALELGKRIVVDLEKSLDLSSGNQDSFDATRDAALAYLRHYAVGGSAGVEAVTTAILNIQKEQWSPGVIYRRSLHTEQRDGSL